MRKLVLVGALAAVLALLLVNTALGLMGGTHPSANFTWNSESINSVNMAGTGVHLKTKGPISVKTTYNVAEEGFVAAFHYHNGAVIVSVTVGSLTFTDAECNTWPVGVGETYIESTGQVLSAQVAAGSGHTEWFTTRLYPLDAADPVPVSPQPVC